MREAEEAASIFVGYCENCDNLHFYFKDSGDEIFAHAMIGDNEDVLKFIKMLQDLVRQRSQ